MKLLLLSTGLALVLSVTAAGAQEQGAQKADEARAPETLHAPTNRVGKMVPTMTTEESADDQTGSRTVTPADDNDKTSPNAAEVDKRAESVHPPTNRIGSQVPTMRSDENKDEQTESRTYNNSDNNSDNSDTTTTK